MLPDTTEGPPIAYDEAGTGVPVLLIHGTLTDGRLWRPVTGLLERHCRTIACHLRGHGRTPPATDRSRQDHVADLLALLDWLGLPSAHLVSHGAGWAAATGLAVRAPRRVRSLTAIDPVVPRARRFAAVQEAWHLETLVQWLSVAHGSEVRRPEHVAVLRNIVAQQTHVCFDDPPSPAHMPATPMDRSVPTLSAIQCPVLSLVGAEVEPESGALAESLFGQVRTAAFRTVPGATRRSPIEAPGAVAELLTAFFRTQTP